MLWLASERRWAIRHRLRARRVARWTGWAPGELAGHIDRERVLLLARLADDMAIVVQRRRGVDVAAVYERLAGAGLEPWQRMLLATAADVRRMGQDVVVGVPW
jgi:hypothetical protein